MVNFCTEENEVPRKSIHSLIPISSGEERCAPCHAWGAGVRRNYLIHYVISGKGIFYCGQQKIHLQKGQIFVIFPGTIVKYIADEKNPWHYAWVSFAGDEARELLSRLEITEMCPYLTLKNGAGALELLRDMPLERGADLCENLRFTARLYEFMSLLTESGESDTGAEKRYLTMATRYIKAHYFEGITVDGLASHIGISRKYLFAIFKKRLEISPKDYIVNYRIERAEEFLLNKDLSVGNVAYSVGYPDPLNFSRMFKLKTGMSPSEYRSGKHSAASNSAETKHDKKGGRL
jgi:AraC family transcriptional regulator of arabinose operon